MHHIASTTIVSRFPFFGFGTAFSTTWKVLPCEVHAVLRYNAPKEQFGCAILLQDANLRHLWRSVQKFGSIKRANGAHERFKYLAVTFGTHVTFFIERLKKHYLPDSGESSKCQLVAPGNPSASTFCLKSVPTAVRSCIQRFKILVGHRSGAENATDGRLLN